MTDTYMGQSFRELSSPQYFTQWDEKPGERTIDVQSYRHIWHHKARADHLCWVFGLSVTDMVRIVEEPGMVRFMHRPTKISQSLVDSGKPFRLAGVETLFAVIAG